MADNGGDFNKSQHPLHGAILCCTSIPPEERSHLAAVASQMGAVHKLDLTSDVTHLIVGDTDTPKYKYVAKERPDVKCLLPRWVEAVRDSWMEGGETDVKALEAQYTLPTFAGLKICVTGFIDLAVRKGLEECINSNGGEYSGDLKKEITHLIACKPAGKKYESAKQWGIRIVSIEWLQQSLERGMVLEESLYDPLLAVADRGQNAWVRRTVSMSSIGKRAREEEPQAAPARKLRRTASAKFSSQNQNIWTDIVQAGMGLGEEKPAEWDEHHYSHNLPQLDYTGQPSLDSVGSAGNESKVSLRTTLSSNSLGITTRFSHDQGLFYGKQFYLHGFDAKKTSILRGHLLSHNAEILPSPAPLSSESKSVTNASTFILVPHNSSDNDIPSSPDPSFQPTVVTDMWIERCLHKKECVDPQANVTDSPFRYPISEFENMIISSTAFEGIDLLHLSKVVKLIGATYDEYLTPRTSVLVCNDFSPSREKIKHASEWLIPSVSAKWLWDCLRLSRRMSFDEYLASPAKRINEVVEKRIDPFERPDDQIAGKRESRRREGKPHGRQSEPAGVNPDAEIKQRSSHACERKLDSHSEADGPTSCVKKEVESFYDPDNRSPAPLQEISLNSPPKLSSQPKIPETDTKVDLDCAKESLSIAISSLLAHHQHGSSNYPHSKSAEAPRPGRRKRQLFGRAPSNLSAHSAGSASFSRAGSVDTLNTDGLGTPLEPFFPPLPTNDSKSALTASLLEKYDEHQQEYEESKQELQMTQVEYEDPEAGAWRERLVRKMSGKEATEPTAVTPKVKGAGTVRDVTGIGVGSVSRRTRQAGAR